MAQNCKIVKTTLCICQKYAVRKQTNEQFTVVISAYHYFRRFNGDLLSRSH